jgi:hypothetical protein
MELTKEQLEGPAFPTETSVFEGAKVEPTEPAAVEEVKEVKEEVPEEASAEESKVPYSRFKKFHDEALRLRQETEEWRAKAEAIKPEEKPVSNVPEFWKELYGDSEASQRAWTIQSKQNEELISKARTEAIEAVRNERVQEAQRTEKNLETLDDHLEQVSAVAGRDLTEKEESTVLDIIDDYTPKDADGNYAGPMLSPDKAWEIYELKQQALKAPKVQARDAVASLSNAQSNGDPNVQTEKNKSFNPLDWGSYKNRL